MDVAENGGEELSPTASRMFRIRRTTLKMLEQRGYNVLHLKDQTTSDFAAEFGREPDREKLSMSLDKSDDASDQIMVFFPFDVKVGVQPIKKMAELMITVGAKRALMIYRSDITPFAKQSLGLIQSQQGLTIEKWRESDLLVDITEHELVPSHQVLDEPAKKELLTRYRLKPGQLPRIQQNDPVARYYGMEKGQVVKITRDSETAGRYITYRICC
jgi:DNA-directed RNA polymerase I, II, and III subunit RPABC1